MLMNRNASRGRNKTDVRTDATISVSMRGSPPNRTETPVTSPAAMARTAVPTGAAMSTPLCVRQSCIVRLKRRSPTNQHMSYEPSIENFSGYLPYRI